MKVLLDTHTFLWWNVDVIRLSTRVREIIHDSHNEIFFSVASGWEIAIKHAQGRLELPEPPEVYVTESLVHNRFTPLPIQLSHALRVHQLPRIHQDPFDRLLVAQSQLEGLALLSSDIYIQRYDVKTIW